uniref:NB-ARC domain-containing protein n=1 Tax=Strongyloides stercoralis TaxID=6248 RepID=A0A0K0EBC1_STRER
MDESDPKILGCQVMIIITSGIRTIKTSLQERYGFPAYTQKSSKTDEILRDMRNYVEEALHKENYESVADKVEKHYKEIVNAETISCIVSDAKNSLDTVCRKKMSAVELLNYRDEQRLYSFNECLIIENFKEKTFSQFFVNEIRSILNTIERYKSENVIYNIPDNIDAIQRTVVFDSKHISESQLDEELKFVFEKVVIIYSTIFSERFSSKNYRSGIIKELMFLKICLHYIIFDMDRRLMRLKKYMKHFKEQYLRREIGQGTSKRLEDLIELPPCYFTNLKLQVDWSLKNLQA